MNEATDLVTKSEEAAGLELTETFDQYAEGVEHVYIAMNAPRLRSTLKFDGRVEVLQFKNGRLVLFGENAEAFDAVIKKSMAVRAKVRKVNLAVGEAVVAAHQKLMGNTAVKGSADTSQLSRLRGDTMAASAQSLGEIAPNNPAELAEFSKTLANDEFLITDKVPQPGLIPEVASVKTSNLTPTPLAMFEK